ncbi:MAG: polyprenyl synthetase family protein [Actinomycetota bacterium]
MSAPHADGPPVSGSLGAVRDLVDGELRGFLADRRAELAGMDPAAVVLVDEVLRLLAAGGKRIRPALCWWAYRAAGGPDGAAIVRAAGALELLHTFALVHDDVMDGTAERRGVPSSHVRFAAEAPPGTDPRAFGTSVAILVGDLAAVLAEQLLRTCGAEPGPLALALARFDRMRVEMAAGQLLDVMAAGRGPAPARVAALKTGSYTAEGPVLVGAALAGAPPAVEGSLRVFAGLLGEAFQLRDDVLDGEAGPDEAARVDELVARASASIAGAAFEPEARDALLGLAGSLALGGRP